MKNLIFKISPILFLLLMPFISMAAEEEGKVEEASVIALGIFDYLLIATVIILIIGAVNTLYNVLRYSVKARELEIYNKHGLTKYLEEREANEGGWWKSFYRRATDVVPISKEKDILFEHSYDGIQELDNNLPPWWVYGFYLSIVVAIFYMGFYHFSSYAKSSAEIYQEEMAAAEIQVAKFISQQSNLVDETNVTLLEDEASLAEGKSIFTESCIACHMESGGGSPVSVGPNLTDKYWLHGGSIKDVFTTIKYGVPEKGMIAWKAQLRPVQIHQVASYILSLQGTNPPNAKEAQGELYEPSENISKDSTTNLIGMN